MSFSLTIEINDETHRALRSSGKVLTCAIGAQTDSKAYPLVWSSSSNYLLSTRFEWGQNYAAYISTSPVRKGETIYMPQPAQISPQNAASQTTSSGSSIEIALGQKAIIGKHGKLSIQTTDNSSQVALDNVSNREYTAGIAIAEQGAGFSGSFAMQLYGNNNAVYSPYNCVLVMFASSNSKKGTVLTHNEDAAMLVDFDNSRHKSLSVEYVINQGWTIDKVWSTDVPAGSDLSKVLIKR